MKKRFVVEIEVNEKEIVKKYPNYNINFSNPKELIDMLINNFTYEGDIDMSKDGLIEFGYAKRIIKEI